MVLAFGTLGAAAITPRALTNPCVDEPGAYIRVIAARDRARAEAYARHAQIPLVVDSYADVVNHPKINAVYNPLPIAAHKEWTIAALNAGKHVLCEKSFACNGDEAQAMADVVKRTGLVCMDAFHYRYHPVFLRAKEIYDSGELGEIRHIDAGFHIPVTDSNNIRMLYEQGGGVTMDIGCYPISWVRHLTGKEPVEVSARAEEGPPKVDTFLEAQFTFDNGVTATASGDMRHDAKLRMGFEVTGSKGTLIVHNPLVPQTGHEIRIQTPAGERVETRDRRPSYGYQLDAFLAAVNEGATLFTDADDGVRQMRLIDRCYQAAGLPIRGL